MSREDALKSVERMENDSDWIIGCLRHDGFIKTDRFDKANQIILEALTEEESDGCFGCRYEFRGAEDLPCTECRNNYLSKYEPKRSDLISRADLFNALATIHAPMEANEYKAEVYKIINEMKGE